MVQTPLGKEHIKRDTCRIYFSRFSLSLSYHHHLPNNDAMRLKFTLILATLAAIICSTNAHNHLNVNHKKSYLAHAHSPKTINHKLALPSRTRRDLIDICVSLELSLIAQLLDLLGLGADADICLCLDVRYHFS